MTGMSETGVAELLSQVAGRSQWMDGPVTAGFLRPLLVLLERIVGDGHVGGDGTGAKSE